MSKKILILTSRLPYPVIGGDKLRIYYVCKALRDAGYELTLFSFVQNEGERQIAETHEDRKIFNHVQVIILPAWKSYLQTLLGFFTRKPLQVNYYWSRSMLGLVQGRVCSDEYEAILTHLIRMAPYILDPYVSDPERIKKVVEFTDAISLNYKRSREQGFGGLMSMIYRIEEKRVLAYEKECLLKSDYAVVVSKVDADWLNKNTDNKFQDKIKVFGNGVMDEFLNFEATEDYDKNLIIFIGNLRTYQNQDAVLYFVREIYPLIKKEIPEACFRIIGANPPNQILKLNGQNGIEVTGEVKDVKEVAKKAAISVAPMRIGAGVQNKILESMALGIPVVATSSSANGIISAKNNEHLIIADSPEDLSGAVIGLLRDRNKRNMLSMAGQKLVKENYTFEKQLAGYSQLLS